jgi:hypothetical protein
MSRAPDSLEARKELLIARSAVERARVRYEYVALRSGSSTRLPLPVAILMGFLKRGSATAAIGKVTAILAVVRTVLSLVRMVRRR